MNDNANNPIKAAQLREMSVADFAQLGTPEVAFVKQMLVNNSVVWSIHAADGTQMGIAPTRDIAFAAVRQHDIEPLSVH